MAREDTCELYVRLLCQYEPRAVLPFLQSHASYRCETYDAHPSLPLFSWVRCVLQTRLVVKAMHLPVQLSAGDSVP